MIEQAGKKRLICIQSRGPKKPNDHDRSPKFPEKAVSHTRRSTEFDPNDKTYYSSSQTLLFTYLDLADIHKAAPSRTRDLINHCGFEPGSVAAAVTRTGWEKLEWNTMQTTTVTFLFAKPTSLPQSTLSTSTSLIIFWRPWSTYSHFCFGRMPVRFLPLINL